jgi:hypothetical protein
MNWSRRSESFWSASIMDWMRLHDRSGAAENSASSRDAGGRH